MTVTLEVKNQKTLNLLNDLESLGLIHVQPPATQNAEKTAVKDKRSFVEKYRGIHAGIPGASVEDFLADCRADKEREFALEKRRDEENAASIANATIPS